MGTRKNSFNEIGYNAAIARMPTALKEAAIEHETNRQRVVASILLELQFMMLAGFIKNKELLRLSKAASQNTTGNKDDATEAAHCVPRQVRIGTETVQEILFRVFPERAWAVSVMFGETDILPVNFNRCDSLAEKKGLEESFRKACQYAIGFDLGSEDKETDVNLILMRAQTAYAIYKDGAAAAYLECLQFVKDKFKPILFPQQLKTLTEQYQILEQYDDTLRYSPGKEKGISMSKIEGLMVIYNLR